MAFSVKGNMNKDEFKESEFFIRLEYKMLDPETDEQITVWFPGIIYVDNVKKNKVSGEGEFQELLLHGNDLLDAVREAGKELAPGASLTLKGFEPVLYRRKTNQSVNHKKLDWKIS